MSELTEFEQDIVNSVLELFECNKFICLRYDKDDKTPHSLVSFNYDFDLDWFIISYGEHISSTEWTEDYDIRIFYNYNEIELTNIYNRRDTLWYKYKNKEDLLKIIEDNLNTYLNKLSQSYMMDVSYVCRLNRQIQIPLDVERYIQSFFHNKPVKI